MCSSLLISNRSGGGGGGGGGSQGMGCSFSPLTAQEWIYWKLLSFTMNTKIHKARYVKHILGRIYALFTLFRYHVRERGGGGGAPKRFVHNQFVPLFSL